MPDVHYGRKKADFGQGFYLTPEDEFAIRWASVKKNIFNTYEFDPEGLKIYRFCRDEDWFSYIFGNRRGKKDILDADVVIGPIANDTIYDTMGIITSGYLTDSQALKLLQLGPEYTQIALKTERAASRLTWKTARELYPDEIMERKKDEKTEEEEYFRLIGEAIETF